MANDNLSGERADYRGGRVGAPLSSNGSAEGPPDPASDRPRPDPHAKASEGEHYSPARRLDHSPAALLRQLVGETALLFRKEIALAASEVGQSIESAKAGAISLASGGAVLYAGVLFLLGAAAFALALVVPMWAGWLIVGAVTTIVGFMMVQAGKRRVSANSFAPTRTVDALRKDSDAIRRQM
jgi:hypothetical protein